MVFGVICVALALLGAAAAHVSGMSWLPVFIPVGAFAVTYLWLSRFRLTFGPNHVSYASLFVSPRSIPVAAVVSVGPAPRTRPWESPLTVVVRSNSGEELRVNLKVFPREAARRLFALGQP